jgi:methylmalonyl-CoA mutase cobalamin-binding subunit
VNKNEKNICDRLGYVGLPTAVVFASRVFSVVGVDVDAGRVEAVNSGRCYLREPGLDVLLRDVVSRGLLRATTETVRAVRESDAVVIAVPTPVRDGVADLSYLKEVLLAIREGLHRGLLVVIESTIPPGTTVGFAKPLLEESGLRVEEDFYLAHVPERIAPGRAIEELLNMPRVVGGVGPRSTEKALELCSKVNAKLLVIEDAMESKASVCPVCGRPVENPEVFWSSRHEAEAKSLESIIKDYEAKIKSAKEERARLWSELEKVIREYNEIKEIKSIKLPKYELEYSNLVKVLESYERGEGSRGREGEDC